ncbi:MAG: FecR domain-containing protein, partial [Bacteroidales bacterium]|nr:FecR domain-containing protein [Bacteroidales bacterium]
MEPIHKLFELAKSIAARIIGIGTESDKKRVEDWIEEDGSHNLFVNELADKKEFLKNEDKLRNFPPHQAWKEAKSKISFTKTYKIRKVLPYAAAILVLLTSATLLYLTYDQKRGEVENLADIPPGIKGAVLILEDGRSVDVNSSNIFEIRATDGIRIQKDSAGLDYKPDPESSRKKISTDDKEVYNIIQTSKGMEYPLRLADGTKIYINSGSRLKFPVSFKGKERVVELEGEAFFEVAKDSSRPFVVKSGDVEIRVLGTQFNLKSYSDDEFIVTTL